MRAQITGQNAARVFHLHGGGETFAAGGRAAVEHAHARRSAGCQHGQLRGGILYTDRPGLEQRQRLKITRTGDEEASMQPRVRLIGDPRFVQRGSDLFRCGFQGIYLQRSLRNIIIGGEERFERFVIHRRAQTVNKRLRVRILCGQIMRLDQFVPSAGEGAQ